ncbi:hypothetical protein [Chromohalobacter sp. 296-RDG]|uniref:hypothetical protein n=1 Tax=Chromohalobacter sp. 296-RDG TaxID=2994062 RepID=UPI0024696CA2|nr:hypothetical protein [Chromohalobacter sp. 296-RDG]
MTSNKPARRDELTSKQRFWGVVAASALILIGFLVWYFPPIHSLVERGPDGKAINTIYEQVDGTTPFSILVIGGLILLGFVLNGLRFTKITAGSVSAEAKDAGEAAEDYYESTGGERDEEEVSVEDKESPEPSESPITYVEHDDGRYSVYSLTAVPVSVLGDSLSKWPEDVPKPDDLSAFEFATRKTGKGNHPWTIKFKGRKALTVSYGGHGKSEATVSESG